MIYRTLAFFCLAAFYIIYFAKNLALKKKGIEVDKLGKKENGKNASLVEVALKAASVVLPVIQLVFIILGRSYLPIMWKVIGVYFMFFADLLFLSSVVAMKDSWRAGVGEGDKNRRLITDGIYRFSRNPAFLAFDLMYIGIVFMYCNIFLIVPTAVAIVIFHLQIFREEKYLQDTFKDEYTEYKKTAGRYIGYGRLSFLSIRMYAYFILFVWSVFYTVTLLIYAGVYLSWIWIWPLIGAFALVRFVMLKIAIDKDKRIRIPEFVKMSYYLIFGLFFVVFITVEINVFRSMSAEPKENLDYVIVLGAGVNGTSPSKPLAKRIEEAYDYMSENPDTILVASGGQGFSESISEAECIRNELVSKGIDEDRILLEDKSKSTVENLRFSLEIIGDPSKQVGIITNGFHEYRAGLIAKKVGYENASSVPAVTLFPVGIHYMLREFFGVVRLWMEYKSIILY